MLHVEVESDDFYSTNHFSEERMKEIHGDILTDGSIEQAADEAVRNEERGKLILKELKILARGTNSPVIDRMTIKAIAE